MAAEREHKRRPPLEPPAKKKKGSKGNPPGIFDHNSGDKQARLIGAKVAGKAYQRPIPGRFKSIEAAVAAQKEALQKFAAGGVEAVWPTGATVAERNQRGQVRRVSRSRLSRVLRARVPCAGLEA